MKRLISTFSERIKNFRTGAGLTQAELARKLHLTRASVNSWETGLSLPSVQSVADLAELFNVSTDTILGVRQEYTLDISDLTDEQKRLVADLVRHFHKENKKDG